MKRLLSVLFAVIILMGVSGCSEKKERYDYPDKFTPEYCYENYSPMELNYIYSHTYENTVPGGYYYNGSATWRWFYAIPNVSEDQFLACRKKFGFVGSSYDAIVYRSNNFEITPLEDWSIDYIELCRYNYDEFSGTDEESIQKYGDIIYHSSIKTISDETLSKQLLDCINDKSGYYSNNMKGQEGEKVRFFDGKKNYTYAVRIHFNETEMIMWHTTLMIFNGHYYLAYYSDPCIYPLIPLTEELEEFISSSIDTAN